MGKRVKNPRNEGTESPKKNFFLKCKMVHTVIFYGQNNGHEMASVFQFDHFLNVNNPPHICSTLYMQQMLNQCSFNALRMLFKCSLNAQ